MIEQPELLHLLIEAINASVRAGALIMEVYNSDDFQVNLKSDSTPLTLADRKANSEIVESLMKTRIPVMSEEGRNLLYEERKGWEYFWLVDPLDGTKEFIKRNGEFTVNIALVYLGFPILGVVYVPVSKCLYFAMKGLGSYRMRNVDKQFIASEELNEITQNATRLPMNSKCETFTVVTSRSHVTPETQEYIEKLRREKGRIETISRGSSLKICMVAEGNADIYPRFGNTTEWDTAAGQAVAEEAGCEMISLEDGKRIVYNKEDIQNPWFIVKRKV
ncbi:MAG TPA: 3'(2'),5'-bisphosphate nucleotidase CysQ [Tenuifilaceae bacterium]|nr:3'(2'),5'-bisphosphate nucleotidase CysQ [Tenuifilaceae bacterium]HPE17214.1 3'(2'),5'-bisphosphate nucleotidase CysQ [Tenuifilaceae bacterium]HPJ44738.1 3'(2'),5'-bisphosphate nucleotidase CysQ [Tenuifilaceae bacterium]HPQ33326.1 3'(2'),5'-bisphosphate nucleotidase CysQ [Tenuifilaceae bacterium]HRX68653.1 3'(2'),5'-bisphosphate nucleotidase CysQ [Tenuifilaceae bacterium]